MTRLPSLKWFRDHPGQVTIFACIFSCVLLALSIMVFLNRAGIFFAPWRTKVLTNIQLEQGFSYAARTGHPELSSRDQHSFAQVWENGKPLAGPANAPHDVIRQIGQGRYSFWNNMVYFSASDNTDPRTNGRTYEIVYPPGGVSGFVKSGIYLLTILTCTGTLFWMLRKRSPSLQARELLFFSCAVVLFAFLIPRLPWFTDYPLPIIQYDTSSYFAPVRQIFSGHLPNFYIYDLGARSVPGRTPGYPLFLAAIFLISPRLLSVVILQNLLTLVSTIFFLWAVYKTYGRLVIGAALAMVAHIAQPLLSGLDFSIITESLFTSLLLFCLGFLCLAVQTRWARYFFVFSALGGLAILVRPSGMFLLGSLLLILIYLVVNRYSIKHILCLALPMPGLIIMLMAYNYATAGQFAISSVSDVTLYGITATYWEPDAAFPEAVNDGIQRFRAEISETDQQILDHSWNPVKLAPIFEKATVMAVNSSPYNVFKVAPELDYSAQLALAKQVAWKAITSHPAMAVKFFEANLYDFMIDPYSWHANLYDNIAWIARQMYIEGTAADKFIGREYSTFSTMTNIKLEGGGENRNFVVVPTPLYWGYSDIAGFLGNIFDRSAWLVFYLLVLLSSLFVTIRSKFHHRGAFLVLALSSMHLAAGIVIALSTSMSNRYASPTRFIEVLSVVFIPLLFKAGDLKSRQAVAISQMEENAGVKNNMQDPTRGQIADPGQAESAMSRNAKALQGTNHYYEWNLGVFPIERGRKILDLGCGPGLYFEQIMNYEPGLYVATDYSANYLEQIQALGQDKVNLKTCILDLLSPSLPEPLADQTFDYVFCFDVLEHIKEDEKALHNIHRIMTATKADLLFLRVPALQFIYGTNDEAIGHFRRYSARGLTALLQKCSFRIHKMHYHNFIGIFPWYVIGRLAARSLAVSENEGKLFDFMVPLLRFAERVLPPPVGLSLYCICSPEG